MLGESALHPKESWATSWISRKVNSDIARIAYANGSYFTAISSANEKLDIRLFALSPLGGFPDADSLYYEF